MKILYKVFNVITNIVTWSVALCVLFAVCVLFVPKFFGTEPYIVLSGSMEPVIHTGSLVYITETDDKPHEGDIIAYEAGDGMAVVHRVIGRGEDGYITKGDANDVADLNEVLEYQIIGKYALTVPNAGYILSTIRSHVFYIGPLSVPAVIPVAIGIILILNVFQYVIGLFVPDDEACN